MSCNIKNKSKINKNTKKKTNVRKHRGGSLASDLVNQAANSPPVMNDFVTSPRVRDGPMADDFVTQYGGSEASNMVMSNLNSNSETIRFPEGFNVKGNISSLNTYNPSGGSRKSGRKSRKSKSNRKSRSSRKSRNSRKSHSSCNSTKMKGGGSDWMSSQYSLGSYNAPEMSAGDVAKFGSALAGSRADYMNPPNLGSAGSGTAMGSLEGANVRMTGSPLI